MRTCDKNSNKIQVENNELEEIKTFCFPLGYIFNMCGDIEENKI